jgi:microcystin-dependent protein
VILTVSQIPSHSHPLLATASAETTTVPTGRVLASTGTMNLYGDDTPYRTLAPQAITPIGGSQPHDNMQPYLCLNFIISLFGIVPSPS